MQKRKGKKWGRILLVASSIFVLVGFLFYRSILVKPPVVQDLSALQQERLEVADTFYTLHNNWLKKTPSGFWELYLEGPAFERGVYAGKLCKELLEQQEAAFVKGIEEKVPSRFYLHFLKLFVGWYNRNLPKYIPEEYQQEIYGWSFAAADKFDFIAPKYHRKLNYHAAHDIGHALQNMGIVAGCTAIAGWDSQSADSNLVLGRNFDFYVGDDFARIKIIEFINPEEGIPFVMVSWPGMVGAVSGMNTGGLTVTLNAAPSDIPASGVKTPVAILARQILQYAHTIEEAQQIAEQAETFVSELFVIGSGTENRAVVLEKTPEQTILYESPKDYFICANHFQSNELKATELNQEAKENTSTAYRYERMQQLFAKHQPLDPTQVADILRNTKGLNDENIGLGNEMAINQLIAHHSVIFKPGELKMWVAGNPSQLGTFAAYDLNAVFGQQQLDHQADIPADSLLYSLSYINYLEFKKQVQELKAATENRTTLPETTLRNFEQLNPEHYLTYEVLGNYYQMAGNCEQAVFYYEKGLSKAIPWKRDRGRLLEGKTSCEGE